MKIYRWHVTRKLVYPSIDAALIGKVDVTIIPAKENFPIYNPKKTIRSANELPDDDLGFWEDDDDLKLEGWVTEETLLQALISRNYLEDASRVQATAADRRIVEDMVLLQIVENNDAFAEIWRSAKDEEDLPELNKFVLLEDARWIDYTLQARKLTKDIYKQILEARRVSDHAQK